MPEHNHNTTWVVVLSEAAARIFRMVQFPKLQELESHIHPESRLRDEDLVGTPPGRNFQRGGVTRHSYESKSNPKELEIEKFAKSVAEFLSTARQKGDFFRLYLFSSPYFLGLLREHMDNPTKQTIVAEVAKDMIKHKQADIEKQLVEL